ncbi:FAD/NAD(P)-binding oxidoreductase [Caldicellulosiruptor changbaiensis]|uniref:FAD/NAD(P)-binding oxidoreductase n=1 Tax=Caldicellulosiruptor changbaiensis TaxID=1222016 RepID=A0A3T0D6P4_9FIRM|nr:NAD(P)/FAD-dependent oxidoreductase [Caldicellulosiruptor changbaiensis]AZT90755.1 FAD/NAD(P)-binding oxidoreductase [Caldicellulosiruptor changbaiensis]
MSRIYDVAVIGAGVVGMSILRELTRYRLKVCSLEKMEDVAEGASKANSGIVHAGYDPIEGTKKARFNVEGNNIFADVCNELDVEYKMIGSLVVAFDDYEINVLEELLQRGKRNGVKGLEIKSQEWVFENEPNLSRNIKAALFAPYSGITNPYKLTVALFENAIQNGADVIFRFEVCKIEKDGDYFVVHSADSRFIKTRVLINCAGVHADEISKMAGAKLFKIYPRRGQYYILDKPEKMPVARVIFQVPTEKGKGILVTPTVDGNVLVGPNSEYIDSKDDTATTQEGLDEVFEKARKVLPSLSKRDVITIFSGIRATPDTHDFIIEEDEDVKNFINVAGIESPGLTASLAIGRYIAELVSRKLNAKRNLNFNPYREDIKRFSKLSDEEKERMIKLYPSFGNIVCRCELVSEYEIVEAIKRGARTIDGIKRRTRAGMGRCQGGFCTPRVIDILSRELGVSKTQITKFGKGSYILTEKRWGK